MADENRTETTAPLVGIIMGSKSDLPAMEACTAQLEEFGVPYELVIASAHRAPAKVHEWASTAADRGIRVIVAGLDTDYLGLPFGPMPRLMAVAEDVQKVHAICVRCGALANHSHRLSKSQDLVLLGEKDVYEPLCRDCYNAARAAEQA